MYQNVVRVHNLGQGWSPLGRQTQQKFVKKLCKRSPDVNLKVRVLYRRVRRRLVKIIQVRVQILSRFKSGKK